MTVWDCVLGVESTFSIEGLDEGRKKERIKDNS